MHKICEDCGAYGAYEMESVRDSLVTPPDTVTTVACDDHRLDVTERMLNLHSNVRIVEILG